MSSTLRNNTEDLRQLKLLGWSVVGVLLAAWAGWVSLLAISSQQQVTAVEVRESVHYEALHSDLAEVKTDVKLLLSRTARSSNETTRLASGFSSGDCDVTD